MEKWRTGGSTRLHVYDACNRKSEPVDYTSTPHLFVSSSPSITIIQWTRPRMSTISRLSSRRHSAACRAFRNLYPELKTGIRHELPSVNARLYGDGLICKETKDKANEDATLDEVEDYLKSDESVFEAFISVLSETSCGVTLVKKLRSFFEHHLGNRETPLAEDVAAPSLLQYTPSEQVSTILGVCVSRWLFVTLFSNIIFSGFLPTKINICWHKRCSVSQEG